MPCHDIPILVIYANAGRNRGIASSFLTSAVCTCRVISVPRGLKEPSLIDNATRLYRHSITVAEKDGARRTIEWSDHATEFLSLELYKHSVVAFGRIGTSAAAISIINLAKHTETDFIICRAPAISRDHRWLAYLQFTSRQGPEDSRFDAIIVYDLDKSPEDQHARSESPLGWTWDSASKGTAIFPADLAGKTYRWNFDHPINNVAVLQKLLWLSDSPSLAFIGKAEGITWLYVARLGEETTSSSASRTRVDPQLFHPTSPNTSISRLQDLFQIEDISLADDGQVMVRARPESEFGSTTAIMQVPK